MPATLPCPKMPKQPAKSLWTVPSRSVRWAARKRTVAWATVSRTVSLMRHLPLGRRAAWPRSVRASRSLHLPEGQPRVDRLAGPGATHPGVRRVVADQPGPLGARPGHDVEVVEVVAGRGHRRAVPAARDEHRVAGANLGEHLGRAVHPLVRRAAAAYLVPVDL